MSDRENVYERIRRLDGGKAIEEARASRIRIDSICRMLEEAEGGKRLDAGETANLARALLFLRAQSIDVEYARAQFRDVLPINSAVPAGATSYSVPQYDFRGEAKLITNPADDLPSVNVLVSETTVGIQSYGASYSYSVQDLLSAAMSGSMLDQKKQQAVRDVIDRKHDVLAAAGDSAAGLGGFANNGSVDSVSLASVGTWAAKAAAHTGYKILDDIQAAVLNIIGDTQGMHRPTAMAADSSTLELVRSSVMSTTDNRTVFKAMQDAGLNLQLIAWERLALADAGSDGPRVIIWDRSNDVAEYVAPGGGYSEQPPQERNFAYVVNAWGRSAGSCVYRPKAVSYLDVG